MRKALLFGASGFIGSFLLEALLNSADYQSVTIVVRKKLPINHLKLKMIIGDYHSLPQLKNDLVADDIFIAIGTTKANTPDKKEYYQIDHDYPVLAATMAKANGATSIFIVTAVGANADSGMFYIKMEGEIERDIIALNFDHAHIFRPSMLMGNRQEKRALEKVFINLFSIINPLFVGGLSKYRGIQGKDVARAMLNAAKHPTEKVKLYEWKEMKGLLL